MLIIFLQFLTNQSTNLRFTWEKATGTFYVAVIIQGEEFDVRVCRVPYFTGVLLHFDSVARLFWK